MKLRVSYIDNDIIIDSGHVTTIEIENKKYFYRFVKDMYDISNNQKKDDIVFYDMNEKEVFPSIEILNNYFDIDINTKKNITELYKLIENTLDEKMIQELTNNYKKTYKSLSKIFGNVELPIVIQQEYTNDLFFKAFRVAINTKDNLLDNLLLTIDVNRLLKLYNIIVFINLKQYLSNEELKELYKYAIYNNIQILLIDSQSYGITLEYESKLIIDDNLDEFMLQ